MRSFGCKLLRESFCVTLELIWDGRQASGVYIARSGGAERSLPGGQVGEVDVPSWSDQEEAG